MSFWEVNTIKGSGNKVVLGGEHYHRIRGSSNKVVLGDEHYQGQRQQSHSGRWTLSEAAATWSFWEVNIIRGSSNKVILGGEHYLGQQQHGHSGRWTLSGAAATWSFWEMNTIRGSGNMVILGGEHYQGQQQQSFWEVNTIRDKVNLGGEHYSVLGAAATTLIWGVNTIRWAGATKSVQEVNATGSCDNSHSGRWTAEHYQGGSCNMVNLRGQHRNKQHRCNSQSEQWTHSLEQLQQSVRYWIQQHRRGGGGRGGSCIHKILSHHH